MAFDTSQQAHKAFRNVLAERTSSIVAWVGAGLSVSAGLPSWATLRSHLIEVLNDKARSLEPTDSERQLRVVASINEQKDYWVAFQMLQKELGLTTYREVIRQAVGPAITSQPPDVYLDLWHIGIRGMLNLNIDRLATKAFWQARGDVQLVEFDGRRAASLAHVLKSSQPFIANLHGQAEDSDSWVFTRNELNHLLGDEAYRSFIRTCVTSNTVLFLGLSIEDVSVGGHIAALADLGVDAGAHYWITDRRTAEIDRWAERNGIRVIRYSTSDGSHSELKEFFQDLLSYVPKEDPSSAPPVLPVANPCVTVNLPTPRVLALQEAESIRRQLNARACEILKSGSASEYEEYEEFCREYDEAIYRAWYLSTAPNSNRLFDYTLIEEAARGAFGRVYRATDPDGKDVAIKVLLEEIRADPELLKSFRRGVRSMRILGAHRVEGMVAYKEASEIPAFVVMDWIEGPNLTEAVLHRNVDDWPTLLRIAHELTDTIRRAHLLPERVLHRDLRPSNIMLEGYFTTPHAWKVVVLDFDLSWHRGAIEKSVMHGSTKFGYLAPEQIENIPGVSTRHASVDSFGLGMTLYFMLSRLDPSPGQHRYSDWEKSVYEAAACRSCPQWRSIPTRFARLVINATRDRQSERWDMSQIQLELERLVEVLESPQDVRSAELIAEELAIRATTGLAYRWDINKGCAVVKFPTGLAVTITGIEATSTIGITFDWGSTGQLERKKIGKWAYQRTNKVAEMLKSDGWLIAEHMSGNQTAYIRAELSVFKAKPSMKKVSESIARACDELRFE